MPMTGRAPQFSGPDVTPADAARLTSQLERVKQLMTDQQWRTLRQISDAVRGSEAGVSARLRDLRAREFIVERKRDQYRRSLWQYRVLPPPKSGQLRLL